jgi:hypothetical protein
MLASIFNLRSKVSALAAGACTASELKVMVSQEMRRMQNPRIGRVRHPCDDLIFVILDVLLRLRTDRSIMMPSTFQVLVAPGCTWTLLRFVETQDGEGKVSGEAVYSVLNPFNEQA